MVQTFVYLVDFEDAENYYLLLLNIIDSHKSASIHPTSSRFKLAKICESFAKKVGVRYGGSNLLPGSATLWRLRPTARVAHLQTKSCYRTRGSLVWTKEGI